MGQTLQHLTDFQVKMNSQNPEEREDAINSALSLRDALESQMGEMSKTIGMDFSQISETDFFEQMSDAERDVFSSAKEQFNELKNSTKPSKKNPKKAIEKLTI